MIRQTAKSASGMSRGAMRSGPPSLRPPKPRMNCADAYPVHASRARTAMSVRRWENKPLQYAPTGVPRAASSADDADVAARQQHRAERRRAQASGVDADRAVQLVVDGAAD